MTLDAMIADANLQAGATRMLRLLSECDEFSPEVKQTIRLKGMRLLVSHDFMKEVA